MSHVNCLTKPLHRLWANVFTWSHVHTLTTSTALSLVMKVLVLSCNLSPPAKNQCTSRTCKSAMSVRLRFVFLPLHQVTFSVAGFIHLVNAVLLVVTSMYMLTAPGVGRLMKIGRCWVLSVNWAMRPTNKWGVVVQESPCWYHLQIFLNLLYFWDFRNCKKKIKFGKKVWRKGKINFMLLWANKFVKGMLNMFLFYKSENRERNG